MAEQKKNQGQASKAGRFVLGRTGFAKISAVEGIKLTDVMENRVDEKRRKGFTAEEFRQTIIRGHRKG